MYQKIDHYICIKLKFTEQFSRHSIQYITIIYYDKYYNQNFSCSFKKSSCQVDIQYLNKKSVWLIQQNHKRKVIVNSNQFKEEIERIDLEKILLQKQKIVKQMKSVSAPKNNYQRTLNSSFSTPDKKINKSRLNTQSTLKLSGEMMSVQSYLYEQAHLKEEASKKEIMRQIRSVIDNLEKNKSVKQLNQQLSKLIVGLRTCIHQQEVSSYIIQLIQIMREITNNHQNQKQNLYDKDKAILIQRIHELEQQAKENQFQLELQMQRNKAQERIKNLEVQLEQIKQIKNQNQNQPKKQQTNTKEKMELKNHIKLMQTKIQTLSEKEKKLIQLVKAVKSRGIDVEYIYKNINQVSSRDSNTTNQEDKDEFIDNQNSDFADISQFDIGQSSIKRNQKFLLD
ncbi:unnamed protein product (macronuclear) [Paramecium tetraurelia]|uniref:Uncharacterized protein n=1 Tax=Paramecium tetraurelia TaxID=5888 RepID=A0D057_PARTE|nr:uncharacterized protein GSPATT00011976001 [Paramecium tetraurelia]CAK76424.1 unnamed protein product [Paramecium tetraurelia]|eukprot:XP_001443821.1 hypothetical protein (macronuclear) [Paramecium tetraurelia strain d4-2]